MFHDGSAMESIRMSTEASMNLSSYLNARCVEAMDGVNVGYMTRQNRMIDNLVIVCNQSKCGSYNNPTGEICVLK